MVRQRSKARRSESDSASCSSTEPSSRIHRKPGKRSAKPGSPIWSLIKMVIGGVTIGCVAWLVYKGQKVFKKVNQYINFF